MSICSLSNLVYLKDEIGQLQLYYLLLKFKFKYKLPTRLHLENKID